MARKRDRVFALVVAMAFLVTTVGVSVAVIWQIVQEGDSKGETAQTATTDTNQKKLEGTQMDNFTPIAKVEKLEVVDLEQGTGTEVKEGDTIKFDYTGALASNGKIFQSSLDMGGPITYPLGQLISGWQEGIPGMKAGGKRRLLIPAAQAYGAQEQPGIPANSDLVFDITVHSIGE